mmetsp:Transcript_29910/g.69776  ORF Transcript_29910/g.69776 Transcript_29910/m.69776 type:complete len:202 (-) Transcript_29910:120-725(-)
MGRLACMSALMDRVHVSEAAGVPSPGLNKTYAEGSVCSPLRQRGSRSLSWSSDERNGAHEIEVLLLRVSEVCRRSSSSGPTNCSVRDRDTSNASSAHIRRGTSPSARAPAMHKTGGSDLESIASECQKAASVRGKQSWLESQRTAPSCCSGDAAANASGTSHPRMSRNSRQDKERQPADGLHVDGEQLSSSEVEERRCSRS